MNLVTCETPAGRPLQQTRSSSVYEAVCTKPGVCDTKYNRPLFQEIVYIHEARDIIHTSIH